MKEPRVKSRSLRLQGYTLMEIVVVIAVVGLLGATSMPYVEAIILSKNHETVRRELHTIHDALHEYYMVNESFPSSLTDSSFVNIFLVGEDVDEILSDEFALNSNYQVSTTSGPPETWTIYSVGENGDDDSGAEDDITITMDSQRPGRIVTRKKLDIIGRAMVVYMGAKGWNTDSDVWDLDAYDGTSGLGEALGLDSYYDTDGWGEYWEMYCCKIGIYSKGPDQTFGNSDDIHF